MLNSPVLTVVLEPDTKSPLALLLLTLRKPFFPSDLTATDGFSPNCSDSGIHRVTSQPSNFSKDGYFILVFFL